MEEQQRTKIKRSHLASIVTDSFMSPGMTPTIARQKKKNSLLRPTENENTQAQQRQRIRKSRLGRIVNESYMTPKSNLCKNIYHSAIWGWR